MSKVGVIVVLLRQLTSASGITTSVDSLISHPLSLHVDRISDTGSIKPKVHCCTVVPFFYSIA